MPVDPTLWAGTPFRNQTAWIDLTGQLELWHRALARRIFTVTGATVAVLPLGDGSGGPEWLQALQHQYEVEARALAIAAPVDLESYNLDRAPDFSAWCWLLSQESRRLRAAAGFP